MTNLPDRHAAENVHLKATSRGRRTLLKRAIGTLSFAWGALLCWPFVSYLIGPMYRKLSQRFVKVSTIDAIPQGTPTQISFPYISDQGYLHESQTHAVWVIKQSDTAIRVFSPICPHLACRVNWSPGARHFVCPCHGSVFSENGAVLAGPSPRPLDTLPHRIEDGELLVKWEQFKPGIEEKISV